MGSIFTKYIIENYIYLLSTPLAFVLFTYILKDWNIDNNEKKNLSDGQLKVINHMMENFDYDKMSKTIKPGYYDNKLFNFIMDNVIKVNLEKEFDDLYDKLNKFIEDLNLSIIPKYLKEIFYDYYDEIMDRIHKIESSIDLDHSDFIKNYSELIYKDDYSKERIKEIVESKIMIFEKKIKIARRDIYLKSNTFFKILSTWIPIYNSGQISMKIETNQLNIKTFDCITILEDICITGEIYLIKLISPLLDNIDYEQRLFILKKMSSGVRKRYEDWKNPINCNNIFSKLTSDKVVINKIRIPPKNKKDFEEKINFVAKKVASIIENEIHK